MAGLPLEREVKLRFTSIDDARRAVAALAVAPLCGRRLQADALLDTVDGTLGARGVTLRIRREAGVGRVTFKGPVQPSVMKVREEIETAVDDAGVLFRIFEELGLRVWFRYEKYREEYAGRDVVIAIDETPVGVYVELEGGETAIGEAAAALGRTPADYIVESYRGLFLQHRARLGLTGPDMVFDPAP